MPLRVTKVSETPLRGTVLGFEEYSDYALRNIFEDASPLRILTCLEERLAFLVVNPFVVAEDYHFEINDAVASNLGLTDETIQNVAVLCVARKVVPNRYVVNLRAPLIINTDDGRFQQVILQNEAYGIEVAFSLKEGKA